MANTRKQDGDFQPLEASIYRCSTGDNHTIYDIEIKLLHRDIKWTLAKRYREFHSLHEQMCKLHVEIRQVSFPPKKSFNNLSRKLIAERREALQTYLNLLLTRFPLPPEPLAQFIDWYLYEVHGITDQLAHKFFETADVILDKDFQFEFNVLQLYAVEDRLNSPSPTMLFDSANRDFTHVVEFIGKVKDVKVSGSSINVVSSNIIMNSLEFDLTRFCGLEKLELFTVNLNLMRGFDKLKAILHSLKIGHSIHTVRTFSMGDLLSLGNGDWVFGKDSMPTRAWSRLETLDLSHNYLQYLDASMALFPQLSNLKLSHNMLTSVDHLAGLINLRRLDLSHNKLGLCSDVSAGLKAKLGNITELNLASNQLCTADIVRGLYSLTRLNLSNNCIARLTELDCVGGLVCLEHLLLLGNPVCRQSGYRCNVLQLFGEDRCFTVRLDLRTANDVDSHQMRLTQASLWLSSLDKSSGSIGPVSSPGCAEPAPEKDEDRLEVPEEPAAPGDMEVTITADANEVVISDP